MASPPSAASPTAATAGAAGAGAGGNTLTKDAHPYQIHKGRHLLATEVPHDAPRMTVRWHYAVDVPKRRQFQDRSATSVADKKKAPAQFLPFSAADSRAVEDRFQASLKADDAPSAVDRVAVNEDHLFEVDVPERELGPIYWQGPVYEVRRGTWHFAEGSTLRPCEENLATQIENGYLKVKPYRDAAANTDVAQASSLAAQAISSGDVLADVSKDSRLLAGSESKAGADVARRKSLLEGAAGKVDPPAAAAAAPPPPPEPKKDQPRDHMRPLFGAYSGKYVLYTGPTTAWLLSDDLYGKLSSSFFQSITRGVHMGGQKLKRGFSDAEQKKAKAAEEAAAATAAAAAAASPAAAGAESATEEPVTEEKEDISGAAKEADAGTGRPGTTEDEAEAELGDSPDRKIDHLILCCHGIGQKLGERMESINFVHDVNVLRRTIKKTFKHSKDLQALSGRPTCGVQVLPVQWRQAIRFGMSREEGEEPEGEADLTAAAEDDDVPTLQDITVEGVQTIRNIVSDVLLDILLYYQPTYREKIVRAVTKEMNRIVQMFKHRHPDFEGKVSILGHSLGSAISFDILCRQPAGNDKNARDAITLEFACENFYAVGSPIGLFQMLRGKTIAARSLLNDNTVPASPLGPVADPIAEHASHDGAGASSYPKCASLYNIFHPSDPVSYRLEPLVSRHAAKLKPYPIPYTKAGFRQQLVGLSAIPQRALEGASSYWSAIRSSVTNSLVSRSLGYGNLSASATPAQQQQQQQPDAKTIAIAKHDAEHAGTGAGAGGETLYAAFERTIGRDSPGGVGSQSPLRPGSTAPGGVSVGGVSGVSVGGGGVGGGALRSLTGEAKLRALNRTGRVDFAIQEDVFGSSYVSAISAHLAYWSDLDLASFILSYLSFDPAHPASSSATAQKDGGKDKA